MSKKVCDFCLSEGKGLFSSMEKLPDGHYICSKCRKIIRSYGLPVKYDLCQCLVTAQHHMVGTIMGAYLENHNPDDCLARFYPYPSMMLHEGEHCINMVDATIRVDSDSIPSEMAVKSVNEIRRQTIHNIADAESSTAIVFATWKETTMIQIISLFIHRRKPIPTMSNMQICSS